MLVVGTAVGAVPGTAVATETGNEAPLADAGLDQNVTANATVHLDATGSRDPDGDVAAYEWRLEQPDGNYTRPECRTCGRTSFVARQVGTYNATVVVTDGEGTTSRDTLRVHVEESAGPAVTLSGPEELNTGEVASYAASVSAGSADVAAVTWRIDGNWRNRTSVSGDSATAEHLHAFPSAGSYTLSVTAVDRLGREQTATKEVTVRGVDADTDADTGGGSDSSTSSVGGGEECSRYDTKEDTYCNNDRMTLDSNGIVITDADNDGTAEWAGQTLDAEFARNNEGVSYDSTDGNVEFDSQEAYKEALDVDSVNIDPTAAVNQDREGGNRGTYGENKGQSWEEASTTDSEDKGDNSSEASASIIDNIFEKLSNDNSENDGESSSENSRESEREDSSTRTGRVPHDMP
ncbi:PKD domain-containing protein [Halosimplex aquaticum]|uniref:PKD domain-containing protein n=1 Tax=Halosimplex aquaticum TaxID=3026162 RepID=A0ABD5Y8H3_9EURY